MECSDCILCGKEGSPLPFIRSEIERDTFFYQRCSSCGFVFLNPRPDELEIQRFYQDEYYGQGEKKFRSWIETPRTAFAWQRVQRVHKICRQPGRALDIGCGQGTFLKLLAGQGWDVYGTELAEETARRARQAGISVSIGDIKEGQFPKGKFDFVSLWQVIEHLRNPIAAMRRIHPFLREKGIVAVSTPNIESLQARIFQDLWFHLDPPRHLYLFSPETLKRLMAEAGFRLIHLSHLCLEQDPYGWLQGFLNRMPFLKHNLYSLLKSTSGKKTRRDYGPLFKAVLPAAGIFPVSLILSLIMAYKNQGGAMEAYFQKEEQ